MRSRSIVAFAVVAAAALAAAGCDLFFPQRSPGERVWRDRCAECHGLDGSGNTPRYMGTVEADLLDDLWVHGGEDETMEEVIRDGVLGSMPPFPMLSDAEMKAVVAYLHELRDERPGAPR
jgi:mono/diheme cytochrome c family protein